MPSTYARPRPSLPGRCTTCDPVRGARWPACRPPRRCRPASCRRRRGCVRPGQRQGEQPLDQHRQVARLVVGGHDDGQACVPPRRRQLHRLDHDGHPRFADRAPGEGSQLPHPVLKRHPFRALRMRRPAVSAHERRSRRAGRRPSGLASASGVGQRRRRATAARAVPQRRARRRTAPVCGCRPRAPPERSRARSWNTPAVPRSVSVVAGMVEIVPPGGRVDLVPGLLAVVAVAGQLPVEQAGRTGCRPAGPARSGRPRSAPGCPVGSPDDRPRGHLRREDRRYRLRVPGQPGAHPGELRGVHRRQLHHRQPAPPGSRAAARRGASR